MQVSHASTTLLGAAAILMAASSAAAQVSYTESFDTGAGGWIAAGTATFAPFAHYADATACSVGAMRSNLYGTTNNANDVLESPQVGTSAGQLTTISYEYKINNWSANTVPAAIPYGTIDVEYASSNAGPWTLIASHTDEAQSTNCIAKSHSFTPPAGPLFVRFNCNRTGGDNWWNIDEVSIQEAGANPPATHTAFGSGCYTIANSLYQLHADAAVASAALTGNVLQLIPSGSNYAAVWLPGMASTMYIPPTGVPLPGIGDDGQVTFTSTGFPSPYGPVTDVRVHGNAILGFGATPLVYPGTFSYQPTSGGFLGGTSAAVYAWHDYNVGETGSGPIIAEDTGGQLLVTFDGVESYSNPTAPNPSTLQFQCDHTTGIINIVFLNIDANASSPFGSAHLIGVKPASSTVDGGSVDFATALPIQIPTAESNAISLSASPTPVSTASSGTTVIYQADNIPDVNVSTGVYVGAVIVSLTPDLAGSDLTFLGMPGCNLYLGGLDLWLPFSGVTSTLTSSLIIPANVPVGTQLWAQAAALVVPGSLGNGQNAFGAVVSNGVESNISDN
jgi:hypothetical protein